jgi:hypothetical protein
VANRWTASVAPEYYGLAMFQAAAPAGSRLLRIAVSGRAPVRAWATRGRDGRTRIVVLDADPARAAVVAVRLPGAVSAASLERLQAAGLAARGGVTLNGQTYNGAGMLSGRRHVVGVSPDDGRYVIRVPAASAALLTIASSAPSSG